MPNTQVLKPSSSSWDGSAEAMPAGLAIPVSMRQSVGARRWPEGIGPRAPNRREEVDLRVLRARAKCAFLAVDTPEDAAIDAALAVMEAEIRRLRAVLRDCGEAMKIVRVYASEPTAREAAATALGSMSIPLDMAARVPRL